MSPARLVLLSIALSLVAYPVPLRAAEFTITLDVVDGGNKQSGVQTDSVKDQVLAARPVLHCIPAAQLVAKWKITRVGKEPLKDALVHFYVVRIEKPNQGPPVLEAKAVLIETAQTLDFNFGTKTSAEVQFRPDQPGVYLIRVEVSVSPDTKGNEPNAALDVVVK